MPVVTAISDRRYDIDRLHIVLVAAIVVFHSILPFVPGDQTVPPFAVKDSRLIPWLAYPISATFPATMSLFFLLSGWQSMRSVPALGLARYVGERFRRLGVPLIFGMIVLGPAIKYLELRSGVDIRYSGLRHVVPLEPSFLSWLGYYFTHSIAVTWGHLWFLLYLFSISVVASPLLWWAGIRTPLGKPADGARLSQAGRAYLPALAIGLVTLATNGFWPYYPSFIYDLGGLATYSGFFLAGAWIAGSVNAEAGLRREWWRLLILGIVAFAAQAALADGAIAQVLTGVALWGFVGGSLGLAMRARRQGRKSLAVLREASLPVYILHYVPLVAAAFLVVRLDWAPAPKVLLIFASTAVATFTLYLAMVRPFTVTRLLFGMRPAARR